MLYFPSETKLELVICAPSFLMVKTILLYFIFLTLLLPEIKPRKKHWLSQFLKLTLWVASMDGSIRDFHSEY